MHAATGSETLRNELIATANAEHLAFDQYKGYWDDWGLAEVTQQVTDRWGGPMLEPGDVVLIAPPTPLHLRHLDVTRTTATVYIDGARHWSDRGMNCAIPSHKVRRLA